MELITFNILFYSIWLCLTIIASIFLFKKSKNINIKNVAINGGTVIDKSKVIIKKYPIISIFSTVIVSIIVLFFVKDNISYTVKNIYNKQDALIENKNAPQEKEIPKEHDSGTLKTSTKKTNVNSNKDNLSTENLEDGKPSNNNIDNSIDNKTDNSINNTKEINNTKVPEIKIKKNDYIKFGSYNGEIILWKCVKEGSNSVLLVSEYVLCIKAFDASEGDITNDSGNSVEVSGSSNWNDSNIRDWLNAIGTVKYKSYPPTKEAIWKGYNAYVDEPGFLTNFKDNELNKIEPHNGDKVFLLSKDEIEKIWPNPNDRIKKLTNAAKQNCVEILIDGYDGKSFKYWTCTQKNIVSYVYRVNNDGVINNYYSVACRGELGIVPALYLKYN